MLTSENEGIACLGEGIALYPESSVCAREANSVSEQALQARLLKKLGSQKLEQSASENQDCYREVDDQSSYVN